MKMNFLPKFNLIWHAPSLARRIEIILSILANVRDVIREKSNHFCFISKPNRQYTKPKPNCESFLWK